MPQPFERYTSTVARPSVRTVRRTSRTAVQCCQYDAGNALKYVANETRRPATIRARVASQDVSEVRTVGYTHRLFVDDRPGLGVDVEGKEVGVAVEGEDDVLKDVGQDRHSDWLDIDS